MMNQFRNDLKAGAIGTLSSSISAFIVLPLTREVVIRQTDLRTKRSLNEFFHDGFNKKTMSRLSKVSGKAIRHSIARSFTSIGVMNIMLQRMKHESSAAKKGLLAGLCSGFSQALTTTWFSHSVIAGLSGQPQLRPRDMLCNPPVFRRVYSIAIIKNSIDQGLALMLSQTIKHYLLRKDVTNSEATLSLISGAIGAATSTILSMPLIAAETNVLSQPGRPLNEWISQVRLRNDLWLPWRGCGFRVVRASASLGVGLAAVDVINKSLLDLGA